MFAPKFFAASVCVLAQAVATLVAAPAAHAGYTITGSRVIYDEAEGETIVHVRHSDGDTPSLMQVWMDDGNPQSRPGQQNVPFIVNPAVAMMAPGNDQIIRVLRMGELPSDRESLFFFNVLEVPQSSDSTAQDQSYVRFATQARLKFFYRPRGLQPSAGRAAELLRFVAEPREDGKLTLHVKNPTPYHITFVGLSLHGSDADKAPALFELDTQAELAPMIAPYSELAVMLKPADGGKPPKSGAGRRVYAAQAARAGAQLNAQTRVRYTTVNDLGGKNTKLGKLE